MATTLTKLGPGTLTFGDPGDGHDLSEQVVDVTLTPDVDADDPVATLADPTPMPMESYSWSLSGTAYGVLTADGFPLWAMRHAGEFVPFRFVPKAGTGLLEASGVVKVRPVPIGGSAGERYSVPFEFPVVGDPDVDVPSAPARGE